MDTVLSKIFILLLTALFYCYLPLMMRLFFGKISKKRSIIVVVINSTVIYLLLISLGNIGSDTLILPNTTATLFWSSLAYFILRNKNENSDITLYDTFPKVLPSYFNNKKLSNKYADNLEHFLENDKLLGKVNPYNNKKITNYNDIREYYKQYLNDKLNDE